MPLESMIAVLLVTIAFGLFGATLAWVSWYTKQ